MVTCQTPEIEPGASEAETTVARDAASNVMGRLRVGPGFGVTAPVIGVGDVAGDSDRVFVHALERDQQPHAVFHQCIEAANRDHGQWQADGLRR